jgi:hypothetical protein
MFYPEGVEQSSPPDLYNPFGVDNALGLHTQGSRSAATLGYGM